MKRATWLADVLRAEGLQVVEHNGWKTRGHGDFKHLSAVTWHHDASPAGPSPGVVNYMLRNWNTHGAQLWVDMKGTWHVLASGVAFHAGRTRAGKPDNWHSLGVETDHTTGEKWPVAQLDSLRRGTAAILLRMGQSPAVGLEFHRTTCDPPGRKTDPDGLSLTTERAAVAQLMARRARPTPTTSEDIMATKAELADLLDERVRLIIGKDAPDGGDDNPTHISQRDIFRLLQKVERDLGTVQARLDAIESARGSDV